MKTHYYLRAAALSLLGSLFLAGCEAPPPEAVQLGYRGVGQEHIANPRTLAATVAENQAPTPQPAVSSAGPKAGDVYQNVQVLGDLSVGEFTRIMAAMTEWVSPEEGCNYCHVDEGFQYDTKYTKRVARVMTVMTQNANVAWGDHVGGAGVTCYTCHRGKNIPANVWASDPGQAHAPGVMTAGQNIASVTAAYASLPNDPLTPYLDGDEEEAKDLPWRVAGNTALPNGNRSSVKETEWIYSLMMHMSDSLGVNCTYCHNTRAFYDWEQSSPARVRAWHGIRMVREMNNKYVAETADWLPDHRKGPMGDPLKVNCATCHQGAYKPLLGANMINDYPNLARYTVAAAKSEPAESGEASEDGDPIEEAVEEVIEAVEEVIEEIEEEMTTSE